MSKKQIVSFMDMKGGVCKTTLCVNIAITLSRTYGKKILLIDMDPQFNATQYIFKVMYGDNSLEKYDSYRNNKKTINSLFADEFDRETSASKATDVSLLFNTNNISDDFLKKDYTVNLEENFDILMGDINLIDLQIRPRAGLEERLQKYIEINNLIEKYDYILIDSPPTYSFYFICTYLASDTYIIPLKPDYVSSLGLSLLSKAIGEIQKTYRKQISTSGVVYTLIDPRNNLHVPTIEALEDSVLDKKIVFKESIMYYKDVPDGVNTNRFMNDIRENNISKKIRFISEEFIKRMEG